MFPRKGGISKTLSPRALLTGQSWSYTTHCKLKFGDYVQTHEEHDNSMAAWTKGAIALRPTGNTQGGYFFFSLTTGHVLNRGRWTSLPMPNEVIDRVHRMAHQEHGNNGLTFEDRNHNPLFDPDDDGDDDSTYHPKDNDNSDNDDDNGDEDGDDDDPGPPPVPDEAHPIYDNPPDNLGGNVDPIDQDNQENTLDANINPINHDNQEAELDNNEDEELPPNDQDEEYSLNSMAEQIPNNHEDHHEGDNGTPLMPTDPTLPPRAQRESKRLATDRIGPTIYQGRTRSQTRQPEHSMSTMGQLGSSTPLPYQHMTNFEKELFHRQIAGVRVPSEIGYEQNEVLRHTVLTQYTLKKGLQVFGPPGVEAVCKEQQQLHERKVGEPRDASTLSTTQKKNALGYLILKQKRTERIKG